MAAEGGCWDYLADGQYKTLIGYTQQDVTFTTALVSRAGQIESSWANFGNHANWTPLPDRNTLGSPARWRKDHWLSRDEHKFPYNEPVLSVGRLGASLEGTGTGKLIPETSSDPAEFWILLADLPATSGQVLYVSGLKCTIMGTGTDWTPACPTSASRRCCPTWTAARCIFSCGPISPRTRPWKGGPGT